ncbi:MAG: hypothetical protein QMB32_02555 [Burkholderiaceae bacterium]
MFEIFKKMTPPAELQKLALMKFEKVQLESSSSNATQRSKIQMALLCRAFLDRTFVDGAEQSAMYIDKVELALATGAPMPSMAKSKLYQKIASSTGSVWTYAPEIYGAEAFNLGRSYQSIEIDAFEAIDSMQAAIDRLCQYELRLEETFEALTFLREETAVTYGVQAVATDMEESDGFNDGSTVIEAVVPHIRNELSNMGLSDPQILRLQKLGMLQSRVNSEAAA